MIGGWVRLVFDKIYFLKPELTGAICIRLQVNKLLNPCLSRLERPLEDGRVQCGQEKVGFA
eukprot:829490-Pelagomonas_calceolata.AAC.1